MRTRNEGGAGVRWSCDHDSSVDIKMKGQRYLPLHFLLLALFITSTANDQQLRDQSAYTNHTVNFTSCLGIDSVITINGKSILELEPNEFQEEVKVIRDPTTSCVSLSFPALLEYDNATIVFQIGSAEESATLRVQGALGRPLTLSVVRENSTHITVSWDHPFSWTGHSDTFYEVEFLMGSEMENFNTTLLNFALPWLCQSTALSINITAWNPVGRGVPGSLNHMDFSTDCDNEGNGGKIPNYNDNDSSDESDDDGGAVGAIIGSVISPVAVVLVVLVVVLIVVLVKYRNRIYLCNHTMDARPVNHPSVVAVKLSAVANTSAEVLTSSHNAVVHSEQSREKSSTFESGKVCSRHLLREPPTNAFQRDNNTLNKVVAEGEKEVADFNHDDTLPIKSRAAEDEAADVVDELKDSVNFYPRPVDRTSLGD